MTDATTPPTTVPTGTVHDFDFLIGEWTVANRRLRARGVGSTDWEEFEGSMTVIQRLGGVVNVDQIDLPTKGFSGFTLRTFDVLEQRWSIYWINSGRGVLEPPVVGGFTGDTGLFYGDDVDGDRAVRVVFEWTHTDGGTARWQQSFSYDGQSWEANWIMDLTRTG